MTKLEGRKIRITLCVHVRIQKVHLVYLKHNKESKYHECMNI